MQGKITSGVRFDMYALIHKGIRAMMSETLVAAGRCDWSDAEDSGLVLAAIRELADFCEDHLEHENAFVHPAMEARAPTSAMAATHEHVEHRAAIERLRTQMAMIDALVAADRTAPGEVLYRELATFIAHNFLHMQDEEVRHNAVLWAHYSDAELHDIHHALVSSLTPEQNRQAMRWMLPNASHRERVELLSGLRANAPAPVYEGTMSMLRSLISPGDWQKLAFSGQFEAAAAA